MEIYLVGGAVRDVLMGVSPKDCDYVVVGATENEMLSQGFKKVGADFPVFLKDDSEFALARRERKTGTGYLGFEVEFDSTVTLDEDLERRDLTINALAMDEDGQRVVGTKNFMVGINDIKNKILRHVSGAFQEDPVRVLRIARLRARFGPDWTVAKETKDLIHKMAKGGVLNELSGDRIWKELSRALMEPHPRLFFDTLLECDALHVLFPEVYALCSALESHKWHPEGNAYEHTMLVITEMVKYDQKLDAMFAALCHDFGKGLTKKEDFPKHYGHDVNGVSVVEKFADRVRADSHTKQRAALATRYHMSMHKLLELKPQTIVKMFIDMNALNNFEAVRVLASIGVADTRGRLGSHDDSINDVLIIWDYYAAFRKVTFGSVFPDGETDVNRIKVELFNARCQAIKDVTNSKKLALKHWMG